MARFQRPSGEGVHAKATTLELFYDLVFVFAITQVSHYLLEHLSWMGALESLILLATVWWSWNYTTWVTNELDPESPAVRAVILYCMLGSLLMSVAIPDAFGERALLFMAAYVAIQVGRHTFLAFGSAEAGTPERERALHILGYFVLSAPFFIVGAAVEDLRPVLWPLGILIELSGPFTGFWLPGAGRMPMQSWQVEAEHFTERFQLFVIIALGETIVITGATTYAQELTSGRVAAFIVAFLGTAGLWWLYFTRAANRAAEHLERAGDDRTRVARNAYTFGHVVLIAAIIVSAVGDEFVIAHPDEHLHLAEAVAVVGGPALYLLGLSLFRFLIAGSLSPQRTLGGVACVACLAFGTAIPALALAIVLLAIVVAVIAYEEAT
jgi:low temperature requirement protein LtrA